MMKCTKFFVWMAAVAMGMACAPNEIIYKVGSEESAGGDGGGIYYPPKPSEDDGDDTGDGFAPDGYRLVWHDEFNNPGTLRTEWKFEKGGTGWGNGELQYYCDNGRYAPTGQETARISGGTLKLTAYKIIPSASSDNKEYISTRMNTRKGWKYGYIEMRAKLPVIEGSWPAFWMLPSDGKYHIADGGGELDIMEWVGNSPDKVHFSAHCQHVTRNSGEYYINPETGAQDYPHSRFTSIVNPGDWHCYAMEWTHEYVKAFLDGREYYYAGNVKPDENDETWWPFDKEYYLKLNLAIGGSWGGSVDPNFESVTYEVDWVRVYQK